MTGEYIDPGLERWDSLRWPKQRGVKDGEERGETEKARVKILWDGVKGGSERVKSQSREEEGGKERLERLNCGSQLSVLFFWNRKIKVRTERMAARQAFVSPAFSPECEEVLGCKFTLSCTGNIEFNCISIWRGTVYCPLINVQTFTANTVSWKASFYRQACVWWTCIWLVNLARWGQCNKLSTQQPICNHIIKLIWQTCEQIIAYLQTQLTWSDI